MNDTARQNTPDEMLAVITAHQQGKPLQSRAIRLGRYQSEGTWIDSAHPRFNFVRCQYRVKPQLVERWGTTDSDGDFVTTYITEDSARSNAARYGGRHFLMREVVAE